MLDRAIELTRDHVLGREQFGQPLASFQSVQFQLTEAEVERSGLEMLARYALWSIETDRPDAIEDRSEEHTSELQSLMRISYAVFCLQKKKIHPKLRIMQGTVYVLTTK